MCVYVYITYSYTICMILFLDFVIIYPSTYLSNLRKQVHCFCGLPGHHANGGFWFLQWIPDSVLRPRRCSTMAATWRVLPSAFLHCNSMHLKSTSVRLSPDLLLVGMGWWGALKRSLILPHVPADRLTMSKRRSFGGF